MRPVPAAFLGPGGRYLAPAVVPPVLCQGLEMYLAFSGKELFANGSCCYLGSKQFIPQGHPIPSAVLRLA